MLGRGVFDVRVDAVVFSGACSSGLRWFDSTLFLPKPFIHPFAVISDEGVARSAAGFIDGGLAEFYNGLSIHAAGMRRCVFEYTDGEI